jgi:cytosine/adenosine deaminase-related metal-dependent hydrolase
MHASEVRREGIGEVLSLEPDLLVHLCKATRGDLEAVAAAGIPVAVCPRANSYFGLRPPVRRMLDLGIRVCIGTDNAMLATPEPLAEARLLTSKAFGGLTPLEALRVAVLNGQGLLDRGTEGIAPGARLNVLALAVPRPSPARLLRAWSVAPVRFHSAPPSAPT